MRNRIIYLFLLSVLVLSSCGAKTNKLDPKFDDSLYELIDKGFYKNKTDGKMYIKTRGIENAADTSSKVQYYYREVPLIDIPSFNRLQHAGYYATDKNKVYIWDTQPTGESIKILEGANPANFQAFGYRWGKDSTHVYYDAKIMKGMDPSTTIPICFEEMDSSLIYIDFIRDNDQLFYHEQEVKVPTNVDLLKVYCKSDLLGNSFLAIGEELYMVRNGVMVPYE